MSSSQQETEQSLPSLQPGYKYWSSELVDVYLKRTGASYTQVIAFTKGMTYNKKDKKCYLAVPEDLCVPEAFSFSRK